MEDQILNHVDPTVRQSVESNVDVLIVGAGISGLSAACFLKKKGYSVQVLEKSNQTGGNIQTEQKNGFLIEYGPNSVLDTTPTIHELIDILGLKKDVIYASKTANKRYIMRNGGLHALPTSPIAFLRSKLFSGRAKLRLVREPFIPSYKGDKDESLADFVKRRLGQEFLDFAINPFVAGVYAGAPEQLSVLHGFPKLKQLETKYGSLIRGAIRGAHERRKSNETSKNSAGMLSFIGGLGMLVQAAQKYLQDDLHLSVNITDINTGDNRVNVSYLNNEQKHRLSAKQILVTLPAQAYKDFPLKMEPDFLSSLSSVYYPPVSMVFLGYNHVSKHVPRDGFGFLVPEKEKRKILGTLWSSSIFSGRSPQNGMALTTFVGGRRQPEITNLSSDELVALVRKELAEIMGLTSEPTIAFVKQWPTAIPQYVPGYGKTLATIDRFEQNNPRIIIGGNFRAGISVADCIKNSFQISEKIDQKLDTL